MLAKRESLVGSRRITYCTLQEDARGRASALVIAAFQVVASQSIPGLGSADASAWW